MHVDDEFQMRCFLFTVVIRGLVVEKVSQKYFQVSVDVDIWLLLSILLFLVGPRFLSNQKYVQ